MFELGDKSVFPVFKSHPSLAFLDSGASSQKFQAVVDVQRDVYEKHYANIHRGVYQLSQESTIAFEKARDIAKLFIGADDSSEVVFTRNGTEGVNLVAHGLTDCLLQQGDEIIISEMEHHANIVPWQVAAQKTGAVIKVAKVTDDGLLDLDHLYSLFNDRTKIIAITSVSNVLGTINPINEIVAYAKARGVASFVDCAQHAPHMPLNVSDMQCDFMTLSGHKCYGSSGASVVYINKAWHEKLPPYQTGGAMINEVSFAKTTYAKAPMKFEAGTPAIAEVIAMGKAFECLMEIGMENVAKYEAQLTHYTYEKLQDVKGMQLLGPSAGERAGVFAFTLSDVHAHDVGTILSDHNVAVRAGHHCAMPLHERFGVPATVRASLGVYNDKSDIDKLIAALNAVLDLFGVNHA